MLPTRIRIQHCSSQPCGQQRDDGSVCAGGRTATQILTVPRRKTLPGRTATAAGGGGGDPWETITNFSVRCPSPPLCCFGDGGVTTCTRVKCCWGGFVCATAPPRPSTHKANPWMFIMGHILHRCTSLFTPCSMCTQGFHPGLASSIRKETS